MFDTITGISKITIVLTRPNAEETQPPINAPIISPRTYEVARKFR